MYKPEISVVMSVLNDATFLPFAIKSVLQQTYKQWELIIIDDASTDNSPAIINAYEKQDKRIKSFRNLTNRGAPRSLNKGIVMSSGKYIARLDSDDVWIDRNKLKKQLKVMEDNIKLAFVGTWSRVIDSNGKQQFNLNYPSDYSVIKNQMLKHDCFVNSSVLIRKKFLINIRYGTSGRFAEDYGLWLKLGRKGQFVNIPEYMVAYRINPRGISQTKYKEQIDATLRLIRENKYYYPHYVSAYL